MHGLTDIVLPAGTKLSACGNNELADLPLPGSGGIKMYSYEFFSWRFIVFRNVLILIGIAGLAGCAGNGTVTFEKKGEVAGTAGLEVAAKKCAALEGSREWQTCVAHYDGLYTKSNGVIKRSYVPSVDAPKPSGQVEPCSIKAVWDSKSATWSYSSCESAAK